MTTEKAELQKKLYTRYKRLQQFVFGDSALDFPNTHYTLHMDDALLDYGPMKVIDCETDEVIPMFILHLCISNTSALGINTTPEKACQAFEP